MASSELIAFSPSRGASGGILVVWVSKVFLGTPGDINSFSVTVNFVSRQSSDAWTLTCIYGPCNGPERSLFVLGLKIFLLGRLKTDFYWVILISIHLLMTEIGQELVWMTLSSSMTLLVLGVCWKSPWRIEISLGVICRIIPCWRDSIGFSQAPLGPWPSPTPLCFL